MDAHLPSVWIWIIEIFAPLIASVLLKKEWDGRIKQLIALAFSMACAFLVMWVDGTLAGVLANGNLPYILGAVFGEAEFFYKQLWSPYLLTTPVEKVANAELKDILYVQKATPIITTAGAGAADSKHSVV